MKKKAVQTYEEFIGDRYTKRNTWKEKDVLPGLNTNDPQRRYADEEDGKDQINRSVINKR